MNVPPEPQQQDPSQVVHLLIRLPNERISRKFLVTEKLQVVKDFIDTLAIRDDKKRKIPEKYELISDFPRRVFTENEKTLKELNLGSNFLFTVQPVD